MRRVDVCLHLTKEMANMQKRFLTCVTSGPCCESSSTNVFRAVLPRDGAAVLSENRSKSMQCCRLERDVCFVFVRFFFCSPGPAPSPPPSPPPPLPSSFPIPRLPSSFLPAPLASSLPAAALRVRVVRFLIRDAAPLALRPPQTPLRLLVLQPPSRVSRTTVASSSAGQSHTCQSHVCHVTRASHITRLPCHMLAMSHACLGT